MDFSEQVQLKARPRQSTIGPPPVFMPPGQQNQTWLLFPNGQWIGRGDCHVPFLRTTNSQAMPWLSFSHRWLLIQVNKFTMLRHAVVDRVHRAVGQVQLGGGTVSPPRIGRAQGNPIATFLAWKTLYL